MFATLIMGAGPGGTGPLVWAAQQGRLRDWLGEGVAVIDRSDAIGGTIGHYIINSDSLGGAYLECLEAPPAEPFFGSLRDEAVTHELEGFRNGFPPLSLVGAYLARLGDRIEEALRTNPRSAFLPRREIRALHLHRDGSIAAELGVAGETQWLEARTAIMALGGRQRVADEPDLEILPGVSLRAVDPAKIIASDRLFTADGFARARAVLAAAPRRRVVILGGRHSAFSAAWLLTTQCEQDFFAASDIVILCRQTAPLFYPSRAEALADGTSVSNRNLCPNTQRVNRFGGLRGDGRELLRRVEQRPGTQPEARIRVFRFGDPDVSAIWLRSLLDDAGLVIPAFGYRAATVPIFDAQGRRVALAADRGAPAVGRNARLRLADGGSLPNVFGIGLGSGYQPWGYMGGEADIAGQTNSLWLYQNHIGGEVYRGIEDCLRTPRRLALERARGLDAAALARR